MRHGWSTSNSHYHYCIGGRLDVKVEIVGRLSKVAKGSNNSRRSREVWTENGSSKTGYRGDSLRAIARCSLTTVGSVKMRTHVFFQWSRDRAGSITDGHQRSTRFVWRKGEKDLLPELRTGFSIAKAFSCFCGKKFWESATKKSAPNRIEQALSIAPSGMSV